MINTFLPDCDGMINTYVQECDDLIYSLAKKYSNGYNIEDLYQAGCVGVMKASKRFKGDLNVEFPAYARGDILGEMIEYIRSDRNIRVSNDCYDVYKRYRKARVLLRNKYGREPSVSEICSFMNLSERQLAYIIESTAFTKSLDYEFASLDYSNGDNRLIDKLALDEELERIEEPGKSIIKYRYYYGMSQQETAEIMGLSQSKVSREESLSLKRIKSKIAA